MKHRYYAARGYILALPFAVLLAARFLSDAVLQPAWLALVFLAAALRFWSGAHIGAHSNGSTLETEPRAVGGPYRFLRHPLYIANLLAAAGLIGFANCLSLAWAAALWLAVLAHHALLARRESFLASMATEIAAPSGWRTAWSRQARNLAYLFAGAGLLGLFSLAGAPVPP